MGAADPLGTEAPFKAKATTDHCEERQMNSESEKQDAEPKAHEDAPVESTQAPEPELSPEDLEKVSGGFRHV